MQQFMFIHLRVVHKLRNHFWGSSDMEFVKNSTPPDFQAKNFTPSISTNFNSFSAKHKNMSENGEIYTGDKNFTLPPAV